METICSRAIGLVLLAPCATFAADLVFSGALQRVTEKTLTIRIAMGVLADAQLPRTGPLAAREIAGHYSLADQVQITLRPNLELKKFLLLRHPSADELSEMITLISWRREENLLKLPGLLARSAHDPSEAHSEFEHARQVNLERAANMPGFVADETVQRYTAPQSSPEAWKLFDTIESEVTFQGSEPARQNVRINGKPWTKPRFPGLNWSVDFGTELKPVFDPACPNSFEFDGRRRDTVGRELLVYRFSAPPESCFGYGVNGATRYIPPRTRRVFIGPAGELIQYEEEAIEYPPGSGMPAFKETTHWEYLKIGDGLHLLPAGYEIVFVYPSGLSRVVGEFKNHRHFEASTKVTFQQ